MNQRDEEKREKKGTAAIVFLLLSSPFLLSPTSKFRWLPGGAERLEWAFHFRQETGGLCVEAEWQQKEDARAR